MTLFFNTQEVTTFQQIMFVDRNTSMCRECHNYCNSSRRAVVNTNQKKKQRKNNFEDYMPHSFQIRSVDATNAVEITYATDTKKKIK